MSGLQSDVEKKSKKKFENKNDENYSDSSERLLSKKYSSDFVRNILNESSLAINLTKEIVDNDTIERAKEGLRTTEYFVNLPDRQKKSLQEAANVLGSRVLPKLLAVVKRASFGYPSDAKPLEIIDHVMRSGLHKDAEKKYISGVLISLDMYDLLPLAAALGGIQALISNSALTSFSAFEQKGIGQIVAATACDLNMIKALNQFMNQPGEATLCTVIERIEKHAIPSLQHVLAEIDNALIERPNILEKNAKLMQLVKLDRYLLKELLEGKDVVGEMLKKYRFETDDFDSLGK